MRRRMSSSSSLGYPTSYIPPPLHPSLKFPAALSRQLHYETISPCHQPDGGDVCQVTYLARGPLITHDCINGPG